MAGLVKSALGFLRDTHPTEMCTRYILVLMLAGMYGNAAPLLYR